MRTAQKAKSVSRRENNTHINTVLLGKAASLRVLRALGVGASYTATRKVCVLASEKAGSLSRCHEMSFRPLPSSPLPMVDRRTRTLREMEGRAQ